MSNFFNELKKRHVVKAGLAYLVAAWLLIQVLDVLLEAFELGHGWLQTSIIVLSLGFPIWLILAWVYDFSPDGIKKTDDVPFDPELSRRKNIGLNRFIIGGFGIAIILLVANTIRLSDKVDEFEGQVMAMGYSNSLAILPFEDLSPTKDQRYFSDGLARSIYDRLARYKELKLISPTSSFQYRQKDVSIEVIAEELGVRYILEGNVQLYGVQYRASINLVDTKDGSTIWSKTFEDNIENVLATYDEVSNNIGKYLNVTLTSNDVRQRKVDPEAYLLFLQANDTLRSYEKREALIADSLIRESLRIDPTYAPSYASLSMTTLHKGLYYQQYEFDQAVQIGLQAAQKAIELDSNELGGHAWLSNWQWHAKEVEASNKALIRAQKIAPSSAGLKVYSAFHYRRQNRLNESLQFGEASVALDPKNDEAYHEIAYPNYVLGDYIRAEWALRESYKLKPDQNSLYGDLGNLYVFKGDLEKALAFSDKDTIKHSLYHNQSLIYYAMRDTIKADSTLHLLKNLPNNEYLDLNTNFQLSMVYAYRGENDLAFEHLKKADEYVKIHLEWFFTIPEYEKLYGDPRWDAYINHLSTEFNYDFPNRPE